MRQRLEREFFPFVIKPGRYAGGEPGQIVKDPAGRVNYLHAYPDKYEIGQSYAGLQSLYHVVNRDDRFLCERVFAPDADAEALMRRKGIPLFSLESSRPVSEFDAFGFTLAYELVYTNVLAMLDLAGLPLRWEDRTDEHPLILAGGPAAYNPEPMAEFIDLFFVGDAEEGLPELLAVLHELRGRSRLERLEAICRRVESVYVPRFYDAGHRPLVDFAPSEIKARIMPELRDEFYPERPLLPMIETVHQHLSVEIMRGCPQGCRFCQAGPMYKPVRLRSRQAIIDQVDTQLRHTGYDEVSLLSLSTSDYPEIEQLALAIARKHEEQRVSISLPALRPGSVSPGLLRAASRVRKSGFTIAPEAGTERLRLFIRKNFPDQAVYDTARLAFSKGWTTIKLYFMVGLPTETEEDLLGIVNMAAKIYDIACEYPNRKTINVTLSPFAPKPHTPFQWDAMATIPEIVSKVNFIKRKNRIGQIHFKHHLAETAVLQGAIGRGGREMSQVIRTVYDNGGRFDGWSEGFDWPRWQAAFEQAGIDFEARLGPVAFSAPLPWSHIRKGVSWEHLAKERERTSVQLRDYVPLPDVPDEDDPESSAAAESFGRSKKKVASRSVVAPTKNRVRIRWGKSDRHRYLSHLDHIRLMERALRRARVPVAYSQGYNPTMKLSFGPPLPLGFTSESEYTDIQLDSNLQAHMIESLRRALPEGVVLYDAQPIHDKTASLSSVLNRAVYSIPSDAFGDVQEVAMAIESILGREKVEIEREGKDKVTVLDIRPAIYDIKIDGDRLVATLGLGDGGYARPVELIALLDPGAEKAALSFMFHRVDMYRDDHGRKLSPMEL